MTKKLIAAALLLCFAAAPAQARQNKSWWCTISGVCNLTPDHSH
jgi:hypothetical protein